MKKRGAWSLEHGASKWASIGGHQFSVCGVQCSVPSGSRSPGSVAGHVSSSEARRASSAFTLIELLIVVAIIAVLAGLTLAAMGGLNQRAARDRAKGEVAAIVNAIESHYAQTATYPSMGSNVVFSTISGFLGSARFDTNAAGRILDPYGNPYLYRTSGAGLKNLASFDVYSTGIDSGANATNDDIGNW